MKEKRFYNIDTSGLYYKHTRIVTKASGIVNKLEALLTDDAGVIYDHHVFILQATGVNLIKHFVIVTDKEAK